MENFTPVSAFLGGSLVGLAAVMLMATIGRIAGISGIFGGGMMAAKGDRLWRLFFLIGLCGAPAIVILFKQEAPLIEFPVTSTVLAVGGLLVGIGSQMGNGCVSGHGICGTARLSVRSIIATATFMITGIVTVYVSRHIMGGAA
jgi:uncharacterized membrane protein YedE/YeeE